MPSHPPQIIRKISLNDSRLEKSVYLGPSLITTHNSSSGHNMEVCGTLGEGQHKMKEDHDRQQQQAQWHTRVETRFPTELDWFYF